jgi:hypothetical protein
MTQSHYRYRVGELRPSQILFSFGVGAVVDLPNLSVMVMGLEDWGDRYGIEIAEERLLAAVQREVGKQVKQLKSPPMSIQDEPGGFNPFDESAKIGIPVSPFPSWMVCPYCRLLAPLQSGFFEIQSNPYRPQETHYIHKNCLKPGKPPTVIPSRFLAACEHGHLDDFPWRYFVHRGNDHCNGSLKLREYGVSGTAADIEVSCDACNASRRLSDAFGESGKKTMPYCRARHPHLRGFDDTCKCQMRSILLGASNSWFGISLSALSIPTASNKLAELVGEYWTSLNKAISVDVLGILLDTFQGRGELQEFAKYSVDEIWAEIQQRQTGQPDDETAKDLKTPEWEVFSTADVSKNTREFQLRPVPPPQGFERWFSKTVLVEKLREVQSLIGFTRIQSPGDFADAGEIPDEYQVKLSRNAPQWVPTTETKGEGIFLQFDESQLQQWEQQPEIVTYQANMWKAHQRWCQSRGLAPTKVNYPGIRYMLIHSFAHALMRQLAIECGYNAASLRERLYSQPSNVSNGPQAGLLIYTAAPDSEGTLGGLVSLGEPKILGHHVAQSLEQMRLCASDPLCAEHDPLIATASLHWAACHACLFSPETSCERGNKYLDRALLIPTLHQSDLAFFL